jgi:hypothetical protein
LTLPLPSWSLATIASTGSDRLGIVEDPTQGARYPSGLHARRLSLRLELFKFVDFGPSGIEEQVEFLFADCDREHNRVYQVVSGSLAKL